MGIFERSLKLFKREVDKESEKDLIGNLERTLREKDEVLKSAKRESGALVGNLIQIENKIGSIKEEILELEEVIKEAVKNNDDETAIRILKIKKEKDRAILDLEEEYKKIKIVVDKVKGDIDKLDTGLENMKTKARDFKAREQIAKANINIREQELNRGLKNAIEDEIKNKEDYIEGLKELDDLSDS